ncbi:AraC family transcriptional regulator [Cohnella terricola]|uniref:Helix-turn-helix domain-containing protein n=1 Tax=Cohnella terricola TaxID=1289167 RepID=A0A559JTS5_9BACL|nr:AraC family transcriptional regulator [Cohnella terricola]TVY03285.1 helix-turn-helix domain-containing protein [Cohnella terricola]
MAVGSVNVHLCGHSRHGEPFKQEYRNGLDTYIIRLQLEGISQALIDGKLTDVMPGDLLLFKPGDVYELRIGAPGEKMKPSGDYFMMCTGAGMDEWWAEKTRPTCRKIAEDERIKGTWHQLFLEKRRLDGGHPELVSLIVRTLLLLLDRALEEAPLAQSASAFLAIKMRNYIEENASKVLKLEHIASHAGLSVSRAVHLFKDHFGISAMQYAQQLRLSHAVDLLDHSVLPLEQIALETGLSSYTYFHRVFRAAYGISPGAYRKKRQRG